MHLKPVLGLTACNTARGYTVALNEEKTESATLRNRLTTHTELSKASVSSIPSHQSVFEVLNQPRNPEVPKRRGRPKKTTLAESESIEPDKALNESDKADSPKKHYNLRNKKK
ncbi:unnamed protein product [Brachionus calyciflorus]|uniref:Uncharacterized protein n=1 Tax=Brachionus calyciflorus TaxID=104777 RepID=A0A814KHM5_9BILA|nr:unnamed protein product [Brachionus calyciflorus]